VNVWIIADVPRGSPGGMLRHMEAHAEGLRRLGHRATVWCSEDFASTGRPGLDARLPGSRSLAALAGRARREAPDVFNVHSTAAPAWIAAQRLGLLGRGRVVVMSYGADERIAPPGGGARGLLRRLRVAVPARAMLPLSAGVWCVNSEDRAFVLGRYRLRPERVALIPHAADDLFYEAGAADAPAREPSQLLFVGTWIERKGTAILQEAIPELVRRIPGLRVVLAGTIVAEREVRDAFPASAQAAIAVVPRATPAELARLYRSSTLLLVPSMMEGLPIVLLEAMACGCPSLSAANSGMRDVIREGENGWLLAAREPAAWADRVQALLGDPAALGRAGAGARATAERFRLERVTAEALAWYAQVAAGPAAA
jgi:glycosyltransferase involved in cell wall biosynthesis